MARIPMTGGFTPMDEGVQVLRIYGVEYKENFGVLTIHLVNAKAQTMRETYRFKDKNGKANDGAMNAFSFFAKTAMDDFDMVDVDPQDLVGHYISVEVIHNASDSGRTYANLGREKTVAYDFDTKAVPEAYTMTLNTPGEKPAPKTTPTQNYDLDKLLDD